MTQSSSRTWTWDVKTRSNQEKLRPFKAEIVKAAKCMSANISKRWERILFQGIKTQYRDLDGNNVTISEQDILREATMTHPVAPKKIILSPTHEGQQCNVVLFYPENRRPPSNFSLFGESSMSKELYIERLKRYLRSGIKT